MQLKRGRLIDHLHLRVRDLEASRRFYEATLAVLGIPVIAGPGHFFADELWVDVGETASHVHFAFQTADRDQVDAWYKAGLGRAAATMAGRESASIIRATTRRSCSTPTGTMSRPCTTAPAFVRRMR